VVNNVIVEQVLTIIFVSDILMTIFSFFSTFGGNPVGCAAALAVLQAMKEDNLQENAVC
jgi:4-aminobutyrate aminotransferase-like enzyme